VKDVHLVRRQIRRRFGVVMGSKDCIVIASKETVTLSAYVLIARLLPNVKKATDA
jgi:hypothetical protein